jgi:hypothetical protein
MHDQILENVDQNQYLGLSSIYQQAQMGYIYQQHIRLDYMTKTLN